MVSLPTQPVASALAAPYVWAPAPPAPAPAPTAPAPRLDYINALRGLAILGVMLVHTGHYGHEAPHLPGVVRALAEQGARGVQLFFVVSAFTLWLSMSRRTREQRPLRNFFLRRFFRIAPMYYLGVVAYAWWAGPGPAVSAANVLANFTFLHGLSPYWINSLVPGGWSITVEVWFYALAPYLFRCLRTVDSVLRFVAGGVVANCLLTYALAALPVAPGTALWTDFLYLYFPSQLPVFGFGILLYLVLAGPPQPPAVRPATYGLLAAAGLLVSLTHLGGGGHHYWCALAFAGLALALSRHAPRLLVNPVINYLGEISFSLYLGHFAVLYLLQATGHADPVAPTTGLRALLNFGLRYLLVVALSAGLATACYRLVERPGQAAGKRLIRYLERPRA